MRHLNTYKLFESFNDVKSDIKDILRDCEDLGLTISIDKSPAIISLNGYFVQISCANNSVQVQFKDIRTNVEHLINYMKSIGCSEFNYVDTLSEFNIYHERYFDEYNGHNSTRIASKGRINNLLPPDDNSRASWVGIGKMLFF